MRAQVRVLGEQAIKRKTDASYGESAERARRAFSLPAIEGRQPEDTAEGQHFQALGPGLIGIKTDGPASVLI